MKKLFLPGILCWLSLGIPVHAQLQRGAGYLGGTLEFSGTSNEHERNDLPGPVKTSRNTFAPEVQYGYFLNESTLIGLGLKYNLTLSNVRYPGEQKNHGIEQSAQLLPFVRKYKSFGDRWAIFLHAEVGPGYHWTKSSMRGGFPETYKSGFWQYDVSIKPGLAYRFPNKSWGLEGYANVLSLNAQYLTFAPDKIKNFTFSTGLSTNFPNYFTVRIFKYLSTGNK